MALVHSNNAQVVISDLNTMVAEGKKLADSWLKSEFTLENKEGFFKSFCNSDFFIEYWDLITISEFPQERIAFDLFISCFEERGLNTEALYKSLNQASIDIMVQESTKHFNLRMEAMKQGQRNEVPEEKPADVEPPKEEAIPPGEEASEEESSQEEFLEKEFEDSKKPVPGPAPKLNPSQTDKPTPIVEPENRGISMIVVSAFMIGAGILAVALALALLASPANIIVASIGAGLIGLGIFAYCKEKFFSQDSNEPAPAAMGM